VIEDCHCPLLLLVTVKTSFAPFNISLSSQFFNIVFITTMSDSTFHHITIEPLQDTKNFLVWKIKISNILTNLNYDDHIEDKAAALVDITETAKWK